MVSVRKQIEMGLLLSVASAFLLFGYEIARGTSYTLFREAYGKENLTWVMAGTPLAVLLVVYLYSQAISRFGPKKTLVGSCLVSALVFSVSYLLLARGFKPMAAVLFLFREAYIVLLIEQFWSYINSFMTADVAKRVNGPIVGISSLGNILGGLTLGWIVTEWGTLNMLWVAAASLLPTAAICWYLFKNYGEPEPLPFEERSTHSMGLDFFAKYPLLILILTVILLTQVLSTSLDLNFQGQIGNHITDKDDQTAFMGNFYAALNTVALIFQFLVAPVVLRMTRVAWLHVAFPGVHLCAAAYAWWQPSIWSVGFALMLFKAIDYSLFRVAKELLYIPFPFDVRYRTKEVIDVFGYRLGKGGAALGIGLVQKLTTFGEAQLALLAIIAAGSWTFVSFQLRRLIISSDSK